MSVHSVAVCVSDSVKICTPHRNHSSEEDQEVRLFRGGERTIAEPAGQAYVFQNLAPFSLRDGGRMNADLWLPGIKCVPGPPKRAPVSGDARQIGGG